MADNSVSDIESVLGFLFQLASKVEGVIAGGSISFLELPGFIGVFEAAGPALAAAKNLPTDVKVINDADLAAIRAYIQTQLPSVVPNAVLDGLINSGLAQVQSLVDYVESIKAAKAPQSPVPPAAAPVTA